MSNRLEIGRAIAELAVPQIGVEDAKVQARLVQYGKQFENYLLGKLNHTFTQNIYTVTCSYHL